VYHVPARHARICPDGQTLPENINCPVIVGVPWVNLTIDRSQVPYGGVANLSWTSGNTTSCAATGAWSGSKPLSGSESRANIVSNEIYTITCYNVQGRSATDTVSVTTARPNVTVNSVVTGVPTEITESSARCNGIGLIANNLPSNGWFEYGETPALGKQSATANIGNANTAPFSNVIAGLRPSTTYYCRAVMANSLGVVKGDIVSFTTKAKKVIYVKPVQKVVTKKVVVTPKKQEIICSDGSVISVGSATTSQLIANGSKLIGLQLEKVSGTLAPKTEAEYRLSYSNLSSEAIHDVLFKVVLPPEFALLATNAGSFDKSTQTITLSMITLDPGAQGALLFRVRVNDNAQIGKAIVVNGYVNYTIPQTVGGTKVQDEVTAYLIGSIMPTADAQDAAAKNAVKSNGFLPDTLIEWFALFAIILILLVLGRSVYLSWKGEGNK
jgi:hypothetical protein